MSGVVYLLCAATCLLCTIMLLRSYARRRVRLLFWCALCFVGLMVENLLLYVDVVLTPGVSLSIWRKLVGLTALAVLLFGMVWDSN